MVMENSWRVVHLLTSHTMSLLKTCNRCHVDKPTSDFCARKDAPDGFDYRCKKCEAIRRSKYTSINLAKERKRGREYREQRRKNDPEGMRKAIREWHRQHPGKGAEWTKQRRERFPEIAAANSAAWNLVRVGMDAHHWSYMTEHSRDVIYLTKKAHKRLHTLLVYDQTSRKFRVREDGRLLETKADHVAFLTSVCVQFDLPHFEVTT